MTHHPHVHMIVTGGGISPDGSRWIASRPGYLLPVEVLSALFAGACWACRSTPTLPATCN
jgi:hypothetical protein